MLRSHVEGKYGSQNLVTLPPGLFEDMPYFKFLHLGNHHNLVAIPPFDGTPNIRSVTFAILLSLTELPLSIRSQNLRLYSSFTSLRW